jgi:hypothetical protein
MKNSFKFAALFTFGLAAVSVVGCSDTVDDVKDEIDCRQVCSRYKDCRSDSDYDVDACQDRCESDADSSEARRNKLRACDDCIDDKTCTEATFTCLTECAGIVP